jgi:hypothetical protein
MTLTAYLRWTGAAALALAVGGCGDDNTPATPTPSPTPTPTPPPQVISYQPVWDIPSGFYIADDFAIPATGTVTATVDWESGSNNVDLYITRHPCLPANFFGTGRGCRIYEQDERPNAKPAVVSFEAGPNEVGAARIFIVNRGPAPEKGSFIIELQRAP